MHVPKVHSKMRYNTKVTLQEEITGLHRPKKEFKKLKNNNNKTATVVPSQTRYQEYLTKKGTESKSTKSRGDRKNTEHGTNFGLTSGMGFLAYKFAICLSYVKFFVLNFYGIIWHEFICVCVCVYMSMKWFAPHHQIQLPHLTNHHHPLYFSPSTSSCPSRLFFSPATETGTDV